MLGGDIFGAAGAISTNAGAFVINGGNISSDGSGDTGSWSDGTSGQECAAINLNGKYAATSLEVNGGYITASGDTAIIISGTKNPVSINITGGYYSSPLNADWCAEGLKPTKTPENGYYTVIDKDASFEVNGVVYTSLAEAFDRCPSGSTITITDNATVEKLIISNDREITIDLNGNNLTVADAVNGRSAYAIDNYGTMILEDTTGEGTISARGIENFGTMIVKSGTIIARDANGGAAIWNEGDLTIDGGEFRTLYEGSTKDSAGPGCINNSGKLTINAGTFISPNKRTYAVISSGEVVVADNADITVTGVHGGICIDSGSATILGGTYTSTEFYGLYVSNDAKGTDPEKAAVTVMGGEFTGKTYSVWVGSDVNSPVDSTVDIYGGKFNNPLKVQNNVLADAGINVYGGTFVSEVPAAQLASGYVCVDNGDGTFSVSAE